MGKKREVFDPTLPFTPITIGDIEYKMCFDYGAIALAEAKFREAGFEGVYLLLAAPEPEIVQNLRLLFACSLHLYQPTLGYNAAAALVTPTTQQAIYVAFREAWTKAMPEVAAGGPP